MSEIANNILIPVDFNEVSLIAIEQSYNLARLLNLSLVLLYVHEEPNFIRGLFSDDEFKKRKDLILSRLDDLAKKAEQDGGITTKTMVVEGRVYDEINRMAAQLHSKFIVMGTRGALEEKKMVGANTSRIIRSAPCPVITINSKHNHKGCRSILLPLDLTQETRQKVTKAIEIALLFNAEVKVMSALWSKHNEVIHNQLLRQLKQAQDFITAAGVKCSAELVESTGSEKSLVPIILRYAKEQGDIDLIIIMTQQEMAIVEFFLSSSAQEVIRTSEIPVMSVVPKELGFTSIMS